MTLCQCYTEALKWSPSKGDPSTYSLQMCTLIHLLSSSSLHLIHYFLFTLPFHVFSTFLPKNHWQSNFSFFLSNREDHKSSEASFLLSYCKSIMKKTMLSYWFNCQLLHHENRLFLWMQWSSLQTNSIPYPINVLLEKRHREQISSSVGTTDVL